MLPVSSSNPPSHLSAADISLCRQYHSLKSIVGILPANTDILLPIRFRADDTLDYIIDVRTDVIPDEPLVRFSFQLRQVLS